jgi:membrane-bound acyltransferase YfiQ involved in biofilm formation
VAQSNAGLKFTFLSKWTVLILTIVTIGLVVLFTSMTFQTPINMASNIGLGILLVLLAILVYAIAWIVAFIDSIQEKAYGWTVALFLLLPFFIGPLFYSFLGPKNTR